jgi:hypothetical protein
MWLTRLLCVLKHRGHQWMRPLWGERAAVLTCASCAHQRVVRYDAPYTGIPKKRRVA